ncbi:piggyBac transposable element-derived protein 4-like [Zeugodacus cucurbitae]|uniref:piggyBac transposable element-derived protein 4-like n=1 Tax=Zeugodacus cucurbitae TaxID=28588 RepID=UPI0023D9566D|nr:piggyBac transposable element-derived protein 4-like [Zeugodacus cucurbitae]
MREDDILAIINSSDSDVSDFSASDSEYIPDSENEVDESPSEDDEVTDIDNAIVLSSESSNLPVCTNERLSILKKQRSYNIAPTDASEIKILLGITLIMGYNQLPEISDYWSQNESMGNEYIKKAMSRTRFQTLMSKLYFNFPEKPEAASKLYYIEEVTNCLKYTFVKTRTDSLRQSIDESMAKFKGRSSLKQYLPMKPTKRGIKIWQRCDSKTGYTYDFNIYAGKEECSTLSGTLGERVVFKLCKTIRNPDTVLVFDRFFTSYNLMKTLPFACVGTCIQNRKNLPTISDRLKKGECKFCISETGIMVAKWQDSREVIVMSNCHSPTMSAVFRKQKDGSRVVTNCPKALAFYNENMGGVDISDQKVKTYEQNRQSSKWWRKVFFKLLMTSINSSLRKEELGQKSKGHLQQKDQVKKSKKNVKRGRSYASKR